MKNFSIVVLVVLCTTSCKKNGDADDVSPCVEYANLICSCDSEDTAGINSNTTLSCTVAEAMVEAEKEGGEDGSAAFIRAACREAISGFENEGGCDQFNVGDDTDGD